MKHFVFWVLILAAVSASGAEKTLTGKVIRVADGDTVTILLKDKTEQRIRFQAIDAPEHAQDFGSASRKFLNDLVYGKTILVKVDKIDKHNRVVGRVYLDDTDVELESLKAGMSWHTLSSTRKRRWPRHKPKRKRLNVGFGARKTPSIRRTGDAESGRRRRRPNNHSLSTNRSGALSSKLAI